MDSQLPCSSQFPFLDLNLPVQPLDCVSPQNLIKPEPESELLLPCSSDFQISNPSPLQTSFPCQIFSKDDVCSDYRRVSQILRAAFADKLKRYNDMDVLQPDLQSIVPAEKQNYFDFASKRKSRSSEMVRVSVFSDEDRRCFRALVRQTRITYESLRLFLLQEEWNFEGRRMRADSRAASIMMEKGMWLNREQRIIGSIPGILVGDQFFFRIEMCVLGLHGHTQAGIDYIPASRSQNGEPIATSIIASGGYEDDEDAGDVLIYTGHGGKHHQLAKQYLHQKLERGNLAMERSLYYGIEIRVIRGLNCSQSPTGRLYVYDGLYRIENCWLDIGRSGFCVYKYKLLRLPDQPAMGSSILKFAENWKLNPLSRPGYLSFDISMGRENVPVYLFNDVDCDRGPVFLDYLVNPVYPPFAILQDNCHGCDCIGGCLAGCYCIKRNGGEFPYDSNGILIRGKPLIYECGSYCRCSSSCQNRVSQKGMKNRLEVFRSRESRWGVRSLDVIQPGAFICEFTGIVLTKQQATVFAMNGESLIYANQFPERWTEWGNLSHVFPEISWPRFPSLSQLGFAMDISRMRNVSSYLCHSCSPNVMVQFVLYDHQNALYPHLMLFAMENIPPQRELTIDYGVKNDIDYGVKNECAGKFLL